MKTLYINSTKIGEVDHNNVVYLYVGRKRDAIGHIDNSGQIRFADGSLAGVVDSNGVVLDAHGSVVGEVDSRGKVTFPNGVHGIIKGADPIVAGAAFLLLYNVPIVAPNRVGYIPRDDPQSSNNESSGLTGCITAIVVSGIVLMAAMFLLAFLIATAIIWAVMLVLACASAAAFADAFAKRLSPDAVNSLPIVEYATKRGRRTGIADDSLRRHMRPYPHLFLAMAPALVYGMVIGAVSLSLFNSPSARTDSLIVIVAYIGGSIVSLLAANRILRQQLNSALLKRKEVGKQTVPSLAVASTFDWDRIANYVAMGLFLTFFTSVGLVLWRVQTSPAGPPNNGTPAVSVPQAMPPVPSSGPVSEEKTSSSKTSAYEGNTGSKNALFELTWHDNRKVSGSYFTIEHPEQRYVLEGDNPREGELTLTEFTDGRVTATIHMSKSAKNGQTTWQGTMFNTDGRKIPVKLIRKR